MHFPSLSVISRPAADRVLSRVAIGGILTVFLGVGAATSWTLSRIRGAARDSARRGLTTAMASAREATRHWTVRQESMAGATTNARGLVEAVGRLLANETTPHPTELPAEAVQRLLAPSLREHGLPGYWILRPDETTAIRWPDTLPAELPLRMRGAVEKALDGIPALSAFPDDTSSTPLLCAFAPIRDERGEAIAVLALALPVREELSALARESRVRSVSEVYLFDAAGHLLGGSAEPQVPSPTHVGNPVVLASMRRLALGSADAEAGLDLEGYRNPGGKLVIGTWAWDDQLGLGTEIESDAQRAYAVVDTARSALVIGATLTLVLFLSALLAVTQSRRRAVALSALQRRLAAVLESTTDPVCFADADGRAIYLNAAGRRLLGAGTVLPVGKHDAPPPWASVLLSADALIVAAQEGTWAGESTILTADAREITLSQVILCHRRGDGAVDFFSTIARDITERKRLERRLSEEKERAEVTLGSIGDAVVRTDADGIIEYLNPVAEQLLGCREADLAGRPISRAVALVHETTREPMENPVETCLRERRVIGRSNQSLLVRADGREFGIDDSASPITNNDQEIIGAVLVFHDVSRARTLARQLAHQASHDHLTGLVNRHEFERRVGRALTRAQQEAVPHALCFLDLDQFKVVNDTCGHVAGDELLRQLATALQKKVRRRDTLARLGGDEFGVLLEHCPPGQALRVAHQLLETVQEFRFVWEGKPFAPGVSIGVVPITGESESLAHVLRDADAACYAAKERGRNRVHFYELNDAIMALRQGEMQWVSRITSALEEHRFRLYGQPIVPLVPHPGERPRVEILLRLVERDGTLIAPGAFIPAAERYNLMGAVDRWVVREVTALTARHRAAGWRPITSINLSGASLGDPTMLGFVRDQLTRNGVPPESLCFEITETAAIANLALAAHFIRELKAIGCWFALDDFGSGMSSFAYLQNLPVDSLKIAGAFLRHIETDPVEYAMVEAINRVGHVMRLKTVAEGVESLETLATLRKIGVDYAQGYAIGEPVPLQNLIATTLPLTRGEGRLRPASHPGGPRSRPAIA